MRKTYKITKTAQEVVNGFTCTTFTAETSKGGVSFLMITTHEETVAVGLRQMPFGWRGRLKKYATYLARQPTLKSVSFSYW